MSESAYEGAKERIESEYASQLETFDSGPTYQMLQENYNAVTTARPPIRNMNPDRAEVTYTDEQGNVIDESGPTQVELNEQTAANRAPLGAPYVPPTGSPIALFGKPVRAGTFEEYYEGLYGPAQAAQREAEREAGEFDSLARGASVKPYRPARGHGERLREGYGSGVNVGDEETWMTG